MPQTLPESPLDQAHRRVAEAEAGIARQREVLRATQVDRHHRPAALAARALVTMEADVSLLREHLRQVEEPHLRDQTGKAPATATGDVLTRGQAV
jgi:hypothetical protein